MVLGSGTALDPHFPCWGVGGGRELFHCHGSKTVLKLNIRSTLSLYSSAQKAQHGAGLKPASPQKGSGKWLLTGGTCDGVKEGRLLSLHGPCSLRGDFCYTQTQAARKQCYMQQSTKNDRSCQMPLFHSFKHVKLSAPASIHPKHTAHSVDLHPNATDKLHP